MASDYELAIALDKFASEASSSLIAKGADELDDGIDEVLRRTLEIVHADRIALLATSEEQLGLYPVRSVSLHANVAAVPFELAKGSAATAALLDGEAFQRNGLQATPVIVAGRTRYALVAIGRAESRLWSREELVRLRLIAELLVGALQRQQQEKELRSARRDSPSGMRGTASGSDDEFDWSDGFDEIIGSSPPMRACLSRIAEVAPTRSTVLLTGETGTGKELFARAVHRRSPRRDKPFLIVNCAALPATLIESELFGHERGAFTGAVMLRHGRFELANGGTLFLDEIGELSPDVQVKLLRVLQEGQFERLGSSTTRTVDIRMIAATHKDLEQEVASGGFRADLFFRLGVFPIKLPPLRDRREDLAALTWFLIHRRQRALRRDIKVVPPAVLAALEAYDWPGNVRELENVIERALIRSTGDTLVLEERFFGNGARPAAVGSDLQTLDTVQRRHILDVLQVCNWRINGTGNAAERLGLHPNTLRFRMQKLGIKRQPKFSDQRH